ncbi:MAG TPA: L,D-transpeptidase [Candidatus Bathyarchaeia archaeon]|nr:L,D-transpeptidase [Candidatus Bathyarchaeia archaeon]
MNRPASPKSSNTKFATVPLLFAALTLSANSVFAQAPSQPGPRPARRIVVSIPDRKLALLEGGRVIKTYDVAVGVPVSPSPSGEYQIVRRLENPTYYKPGVVIGPGANNPLGPRWIGLNIKGFGIHGTNRPDSIGKNASHGCIRLRNSDVEDLFARVQVGDHVSLVAERSDETARLFGPAPSFAEAHETLQARNETPAAHEVEQQGNR